MNYVLSIIDFTLNIDKNLLNLLNEYDKLLYGIVALVIFGETGLVITPFLPGDSLLFALGALGNEGKINIFIIFIILVCSAILGNTTNYFIGYYVGDSILLNKNRLLKKIIKEEYINKTNAFLKKKGDKALIISRFIPILRTFTPFIAGLGRMNFTYFSLYNVIGALAWVLLTLSSGYLLGSIPFVKKNFSYIVLIVVGMSFLPLIFATVKNIIKKSLSK